MGEVNTSQNAAGWTGLDLLQRKWAAVITEPHTRLPGAGEANRPWGPGSSCTPASHQ